MPLVLGLHSRNQGWTLGKTCNRWGQQGSSEESAVLKISSAGSANIDKDINQHKRSCLGQTSSSTVSLGHYQSDWMLKCIASQS